MSDTESQEPLSFTSVQIPIGWSILMQLQKGNGAFILPLYGSLFFICSVWFGFGTLPLLSLGQCFTIFTQCFYWSRVMSFH